jgi:flagellar assembly factor FliW
MPSIETRNLGILAYEAESAIEFPRGLPGFEERRRFLAASFPDSRPLVFLQSLEDPGLCFITLPAPAVIPDYTLELSAEDLGLIDLPRGRRPAIGSDVLCLAVVAIHETGPTANLLAPVVVNLRNRKAVQAVEPGRRYSHQHPLTAGGPAC